MRAATCFSGIGAPETAMPHWDWLWSAEIEKFPSAVLATRYPNSVNLGDVTAEDFMQRASAFGQIDVLAGGPPCQAFSVAGLRKSMADDRGNLSLRFVRIAHAIRPRNLVVENVPGWLNTPDNAFGCFLGAILGHDDALHSPLDGKWPRCGMASGPLGRLCWATLDAQFFGVAQRRRRVFVVVDFGNGADPATVLFEPQSLLGYSPPRREKGQGTAGTISARTQGGGGLGTDFEIDGGLTAICADIAPTLNAAFADKQGLEDQHINGGGAGSFPSVSMCLNAGQQNRLDPTFETLIPVNRCDFDDARAYRTSGNCGAWETGTKTDALTTGTDQNSHIVAFSSKDYGNDATEDLSPTLRSMSDADSHANGGGQVVVALGVTIHGTDKTASTASLTDIAGALRARSPGGQENSSTTAVLQPVAFALRGREDGAQPEVTGDHVNALRSASGGSSRDYVAAFAQNQRDEVRQMEVAGALAAEAGMKQQTYLQTGWQVRRLTPVECERLQGFPDNFTNIEYRGKPAADGPRYKALGNSWAVPVGRWILERIERFMPECEA